jgi:hypothetical protein
MRRKLDQVGQSPLGSICQELGATNVDCFGLERVLEDGTAIDFQPARNRGGRVSCAAAQLAHTEAHPGQAFNAPDSLGS